MKFVQNVSYSRGIIWTIMQVLSNAVNYILRKRHETIIFCSVHFLFFFFFLVIELSYSFLWCALCDRIHRFVYFFFSYLWLFFVFVVSCSFHSQLFAVFCSNSVFILQMFTVLCIFSSYLQLFVIFKSFNVQFSRICQYSRFVQIKFELFKVLCIFIQLCVVIRSLCSFLWLKFLPISICSIVQFFCFFLVHLQSRVVFFHSYLQFCVFFAVICSYLFSFFGSFCVVFSQLLVDLCKSNLNDLKFCLFFTVIL